VQSLRCRMKRAHHSHLSKRCQSRSSVSAMAISYLVVARQVLLHWPAEPGR